MAKSLTEQRSTSTFFERAVNWQKEIDKKVKKHEKKLLRKEQNQLTFQP